MVSEELQTFVDAAVPQLTQVAQALGQSPSDVLRDFVDEAHKKMELEALDKIVADSRASGFHVLSNFEEDLEELKAEARRRHAAK